MKKVLVIPTIVILLMFAGFTGCSSSYDSGSSYNRGGNYDPNDKYYSENDHNGDGYINDDEFQDAMGDYIDDYYDSHPELDDPGYD